MKIEKYLVLNKYLLSLFGKNNPKELFNELKDKDEGIDSDGRSYFINTLIGIKDKKISEDELLEYDKNIQDYIRMIRNKRGLFSLKYFQYLAVLFTEIVLDSLKNRKVEFLKELNSFLTKYKEEYSIDKIDDFTEDDLKKLAFWMATGSGKTLIMHINYYQFLNYKLFSPDNIILITPNEGLSKQHKEELEKSGIPCRLYGEGLNGGLIKSLDEILIIEITKLVEEKKGGGKTIPVDAFEGENLVFVDEGHKGKKSEEKKWAKLIKKLGEGGFIFEYSATFGQILNERDPDTLKEYAKSIIFDYSYKYFYLDGYGKDFSILNLKKDVQISQGAFQEFMFVANLLSFYEQLLAYEDNKELAKEYNIEKPLWIFVGTTVSGKEEESDVIQIVEFIKKVIDNEEWLKSVAYKIINGQTGLKNENGKDIFTDKFKYLKDIDPKLEKLYELVFGGKGSLWLYEIKNADGEIGLKVSENPYFGVINIGNISEFKKLLEKKGIKVEQDAISGSLFDNIKREDSKINILIGSKKFIEGWDSWRVASTGLLNIGKGQGPQIIQLFGRGVRLKGKGMSLKRSNENGVVKILETLNIYSIKADYLNRFLEAIQKEDVEFETIEVPVEHIHKDKWKNLYILSKNGKSFENEKVLRLKLDETINFTIDFVLKISAKLSVREEENSIESKEARSDVEKLKFEKEILDLLDWHRIWLEAIEFKMLKGYWNLVFDINDLKNILLNGNYYVLVTPEFFKMEIKDIKDIKKLEDLALLVIKTYIERFYRKHAKRFEMESLSCEIGLRQNMFPYEYKVKIDNKKKDLVERMKQLLNDLDKLYYQDDSQILPRIYFDRSLYLPLLLKDEELDGISPQGLVESEKKFIEGLRKFLENCKGKLNFELYLLRNLPHHGIGFQLKWSQFYPDFIMWINQNDKQFIVFIDPKGLEHTKGLDNEKIQLWKELKEVEKRLRQNNQCHKVFLDAYILSITPYNELIKGMESPPGKKDYENNHVLFLEDNDWPEKLIKFK
ncbi:MAG: DEAD/DEAH box helicase family protein [candidate division WOR-3 bacterium]